MPNHPMKARSIGCGAWAFAGVVALALMAAWLEAPVAQGQTNAPLASPATNVAPAEIPQSLFVDEFQTGKDPFFPNSVRRQPAQPVTALVATAAPPPSSEFNLKGITGPANRRFALINNRDFEAGEKGSVYAGGKKVTIKCEKIGPRSVWITLEGQPGIKELRLPGD
jgi:hypothetical protein